MSNSRPNYGRITLWGVTILVLLFLSLPMFIILPVSLNDSIFLEFPPKSLSFRWYTEYFTSYEWISATFRTFRLAVATMFFSTIIGTMAAFGVTRGRFRGKGLIFGLILSTMIVPVITLSVALYSLFSRLHLVQSFWGLLIGHSILAIPYVFVNVCVGLQSFDISLEKASASLGANPLRTFQRVTFPLIRSNILVGAFLAFLTSFDELVISMFLCGTRYTLPVQMWMDIRLQISPVLVAISSLLIVFYAFIFFSLEFARRKKEKRFKPILIREDA